MRKPIIPGSLAERRSRIKNTNVFYGISDKERKMLAQLMSGALIVSKKSKNKTPTKSKPRSKRTGSLSTSAARRS